MKPLQIIDIYGALKGCFYLPKPLVQEASDWDWSSVSVHCVFRDRLSYALEHYREGELANNCAAVVLTN